MLDGHAQGCETVVRDRHVVDVKALFLLGALHYLLLNDLKHLLVVTLLAVQHQHLLKPEVFLLVFVGSGTWPPSFELFLVDGDPESRCSGYNCPSLFLRLLTPSPLLFLI